MGEATGDDFSIFFAAHFQQTVGLVALACGNASLAEDVTQEAFARALDRWDTVAPMARRDAWVLKVASNLVVDHVRRVRRETGLDARLPAPARDEVDAIWMQWNLDRLTPMQRASMILRYQQDMPVADVARALARSVETVRSHLRLGRRQMRTLCAEDMP